MQRCRRYRGNIVSQVHCIHIQNLNMITIICDYYIYAVSAADSAQWIPICAPVWSILNILSINFAAKEKPSEKCLKETSWKPVLCIYTVAHMSSLWSLSSRRAVGKAAHCLWWAWMLTSDLWGGLCNPPESSVEGQRVLLPPQTQCWWKLHASSAGQPVSDRHKHTHTHSNQTNKTWWWCERQGHGIFHDWLCLLISYQEAELEY